MKKRSVLLFFALISIFILIIPNTNPFKLDNTKYFMENKLIMAHRGASAYAPENTLESFGLAMEQGANYVELDLRKTKDGIYVASHNETIDRELINETDFSFLKSMRPDLTTLEETLSIYRGKIKFNIELKEQGYEYELVDFLRLAVPPEDVLITSQYPESLEKITGFQRGLILMKGTVWKNVFMDKLKGSVNTRRAIDLCAEGGFEYFIPNKIYLNEGVLDYAQKKGVKVLPWTVNSDAELITYLRDSRIAGVITDKPDIAIKIRESL